jgi:hypothetical protein
MDFQGEKSMTKTHTFLLWFTDQLRNFCDWISIQSQAFDQRLMDWQSIHILAKYEYVFDWDDYYANPDNPKPGYFEPVE